MTQERWRKLEALFHEAMRHAPETRTAFLDDTCGSDPDMRRQIESLLANEHEAGSFLENAAFDDLEHMLSPRESLVGRQFGPYRVLSEIGAGGMGEVYLARDAALDREVAMKTLPYEFAHNPEPLSRFRREARTLASVNHPNIGAIYQLYESEETSFLVLELVEGEMLHGPLPIATALDRAGQVARALEAAHARGIIHRDLKPANVKVTPQGTVKVLDFGLAKAIGWRDGDNNHSETATALSGATLAGHVVGTPGYMSPEQAQGKEVDHRTDIWAFGCLLYELLAGKRAFAGEALAGTIAAVLEREPDWRALPAKTPDRIRELLRKCLQKDPARRLANISDARKIIEQTQRGRNLWAIAAAAIAVLALLSAAAAFWMRSTPRQSDRADWVQLTRFPDPVSQPALSSDGHMLAFVRSPSTFFAVGQVYVKSLPDGEAIQLTHDALKKVDPAFSPDGTRITYTVVDPRFNWETWGVPVRGGEPQRLLPNAAHLVWSGPQQVLFSRMKPNPHTGIVTADEGGARERDIYFPLNHRAMARRPHASPDGKWVLFAELGGHGNWEPCRVVPMNAHPSLQTVGPPGPCTFAAWSPDGKWVYVTSKAGGLYHIWRQRFPNGKPEQVTSGLTQEEGIAMSPDGRSFVTTVSLESASLWIHDAAGERQISVVEGNAAYPKFTPDGKKLLYRIVKAVPRFGTNRDPGEIWVTDLASGHSEPVAAGFQPLDFAISPDARQIVMDAPDKDGKPRLWLAPLVPGAQPRAIPNVEGHSGKFGPTGEVFFQHEEGPAAFVYRVRQDGSGLRKALNVPMLSYSAISPDGRWIEAWAQVSGGRPSAVQMFPLEGGAPIIIGSNTFVQWSSSGDCVWISGGAVPDFKSYIVPLPKGKMLPRIPPDGFHSEEEIAHLLGARKLDALGAPGPAIGVYAFERVTVQRNLYRIPVP